MHMDKKVYKINNNKKANIRIVQISDIHFSENYKINRLEKIKNNIIKMNPDYICIVGDLIDERNINNIEIFRNWLKEISEICKTIIVIGNHELIKKDNNKYIKQEDISWLTSLKSEKLIVLNKEVYKDKNINFIGYDLDYNYYYKNKKNKKRDYTKIDEEVDNLIENIDGYNILLVHTPAFIFNQDNYKDIKNFDKIDLVLCGHTHGGLIPSFIPGHAGIVSPSKSLFPKNVRGKIKIKNTNIIICGGIMKLSEKSKLSRFNDIYGYSVNLIEINEKKLLF